MTNLNKPDVIYLWVWCGKMKIYNLRLQRKNFENFMIQMVSNSATWNFDSDQNFMENGGANNKEAKINV